MGDKYEGDPHDSYTFRGTIRSMGRVITAADFANIHTKSRPDANGSRPLVSGREVVSRNMNARSGFSLVDMDNRPRTYFERVANMSCGHGVI